MNQPWFCHFEDRKGFTKIMRLGLKYPNRYVLFPIAPPPFKPIEWEDGKALEPFGPDYGNAQFELIRVIDDTKEAFYQET